MTEETPPPPQTSPPAKVGWWFAWIATSIILPAFIGILVARSSESDWYMAWGLGFIGLGLHLGSCVKLRDSSGCLFPFLLLGGWVLMAVSFFVGCLNNMRFH